MKQDGRTIYGAENPGVFTDARCFMDWIAAQYRMRMPSDYIKPNLCYASNNPASKNHFISGEEEVFHGTGNAADINMDDCRGSFNYNYKRRRGVVVATRAHILTVVSSSHTAGAYIFMSSDFYEFCSFVLCPVP